MFALFALCYALVSASYSQLEDASLLAFTKHITERDENHKTSVIKISKDVTDKVSGEKVWERPRFSGNEQSGMII